MNKPTYHLVNKKAFSYHALGRFCDTVGTETERGLDEDCEEGGKHAWLVFPSWSAGVRDGGKHYLMCLHCSYRSHL